MELKDIKTGEGLGNVKFGMTRNQVKAILGEPTEIEKFSYSDNDEDLSESWHYDELELSAGFDEDVDWKLITLAVSSPEFTYMDKKLIGLKKDELLATLKELGLDNLEIEDCSDDETPNSMFISSEEKEITFWLENEILSEIQWGPVFIDEETIVWPE
jgi:hypothetical protein